MKCVNIDCEKEGEFPLYIGLTPTYFCEEHYERFQERVNKGGHYGGKKRFYR